MRMMVVMMMLLLMMMMVVMIPPCNHSSTSSPPARLIYLLANRMCPQAKSMCVIIVIINIKEHLSHGCHHQHAYPRIDWCPILSSATNLFVLKTNGNWKKMANIG